MNSRELEIFYAVMRGQSITEAAKMLRISQPAVSKSIHHLEDRLGLKLFSRVKGRLRPTIEAASLFPEAERLFRDMSALERYAGDLRSGRAGLLRVAASASLGLSVMPTAIVAFQREHPGVKIISHFIPAIGIAELMLSNQIDIAMTLSPVHVPSSETQTVATCALLCAMPDGHRLSRLPVVRPRDLAEQALISFGSSTYFGKLIDEAFAADGVARRIGIELLTSMQALPLVQRGAGVALLDRFLVVAGVEGITWRPFAPEIMLPVNVITPQANRQPRLTTLFAKYIQQAIEPYRKAAW